MELGIVGLGRMGANIARRLMRDGHTCVVYDVNPDAVSGLEGEGATGATSLEDLAAKLSAPRAVWAMVPAGEITEKTVAAIAEQLESGDAVIDGGNTYYRDDIRRAAELGERGIDYLDVRHQRRRLRAGARLLPDDRRTGRGIRPAGADLRHPRPRGRGRGAHPRARGGAEPGRARLPPLRPGRRGPLREDGPQRHRVRRHGGLRRGAEHPQERERREGRRARPTRRPPPSTIPSTTSTSSTCPRSPRSGAGAA